MKVRGLPALYAQTPGANCPAHPPPGLTGISNSLPEMELRIPPCLRHQQPQIDSHPFLLKTPPPSEMGEKPSWKPGGNPAPPSLPPPLADGVSKATPASCGPGFLSSSCRNSLPVLTGSQGAAGQSFWTTSGQRTCPAGPLRHARPKDRNQADQPASLHTPPPNPWSALPRLCLSCLALCSRMMPGPQRTEQSPDSLGHAPRGQSKEASKL